MPIRLQKIAIVLYEALRLFLCIEVVLVDVNKPCLLACVSWTLVCLDCTLVDDCAPSSKNVGNDFIISIHSGDFLGFNNRYFSLKIM